MQGVLWLLTTIGLDSPNRLVIALSPAFVAAAGWIAAELATLIPGLPRLDPNLVIGVFIAGATLASAKILLWLRGWQKYEEKSVPTAPSTTTGGAAAAPSPPPPPSAVAGRAPLHEVGSP